MAEKPKPQVPRPRRPDETGSPPLPKREPKPVPPPPDPSKN